MEGSQLLLPSEILGQRGLFPWLDEMQQSQPLNYDSVLESMQRHGVESPAPTFSQMLDIGVVLAADKKFVLSSYGRKACLLLSGVNSGDLKELVRQLSQIEPGVFPYEIVREGMTANFVSTLESRPGFRRLYICSPWIRLKRKFLHKFMYAVHKAQEQSKDGKVDILVIARPLEKNDPSYPLFLETLRTLQRLGADIVVHKDLHAKIYIREPGLSGGLSMAVFGSENLTGSRNIELGIKITNDTVILNKLITHFFDIYAQCQPWKGE
jgi:hypothetical protein